MLLELIIKLCVSFWTSAFKGKRSYETVSVGMSVVSLSVGQLSVFLKNGSYNFSEIIHEARGPKTDRFFDGKILILGKVLENSSKIRV